MAATELGYAKMHPHGLQFGDGSMQGAHLNFAVDLFHGIAQRVEPDIIARNDFHHIPIF